MELQRVLSRATLATAAGLALAGPAHAKEKLNLFIWSEYIDPEIVKEFERRFDVEVTVDLYEDNESMLAKLQGGGSSLYDVVVASDFIVPALLHLKLLAQLPQDKIPNLKNLDPRFASPPFDPGNRHTAGYQWGTVGLYARKKKDGSEIERTWGLIFDPKKQIGPFMLMDSMREMMGAGLVYLGYDLSSSSIPELKRARDLILDAKRRSIGFEGGVGGKNKVLAKTAAVAVVYNGDAVRGIDEDKDTVFFVPKEGGEIWMDSMAMPARAPHRDTAAKFINFILEPEIGAKLSNFTRFATPNQTAKPLVRPEDLANAAIYPPEETMSKLSFLKDLGIDARLYDEAWTQIKSK